MGCNKAEKVDIIVYPEYCGGCIETNFALLNNQELKGKFNLYLDSNNHFLLHEARINKLNFIQIDNDKIREKFGDYDNIVVLDRNGKKKEMPTNKKININALFHLDRGKSHVKTSSGKMFINEK